MQLFEAIKQQQLSRTWEAKISEKREKHQVILTFLPPLLVRHLPVCKRVRWEYENKWQLWAFSMQSHRDGIWTAGVLTCQRSWDWKDQERKQAQGCEAEGVSCFFSSKFLPICQLCRYRGGKSKQKELQRGWDAQQSYPPPLVLGS